LGAPGEIAIYPSIDIGVPTKSERKTQPLDVKAVNFAEPVREHDASCKREQVRESVCWLAPPSKGGIEHFGGIKRTFPGVGRTKFPGWAVEGAATANKSAPPQAPGKGGLDAQAMQQSQS